MLGGYWGCGPYGRRYLTREEKIERLENYKEWLEKEAEGVKERLEEIKQNK